MAKLENIELIFMDVCSRKRTPPLPFPLPTESTLRSQLAYPQIHILPSVPEPSVLLQSSTSQLHLPSESPAPVFLPAFTQTTNHEYYSPCDMELLLDLDLHLVDTDYL